MRRHVRIALTAVVTAGMLLAAAPGAGQAATGYGRDTWAQDAFPVGNARPMDAARVDGDTTWAVGSRKFGEGRQSYSRPVIFSHDDDSSEWAELPVPDGLSSVRSVTAGPAGTTWLAGSRPPAGDGIPTAWHDAGGWHVRDAPVPDGSLAAGFNALATVAVDEVWAVGWRQPADFLTFHGLIERWDGTNWHQVEPPVIDSDYWTLSDVVATGRDDIWATGAVGTPEGRPRPLLLHYDGRAWTRVQAPALDGRYGELAGLAAAGPNDVWAVGTEEIGAPAKDHGLVAHFDGHSWTRVNAGAGPGRWQAITAGPAGVAAVGTAYADGLYRPVGVQRTRGGGWKPLYLPAGDGVQGRAPVSVVSTGRGLTVVGYEPQGESESGQPLPPTPFALTRR